MHRGADERCLRAEDRGEPRLAEDDELPGARAGEAANAARIETADAISVQSLGGGSDRAC